MKDKNKSKERQNVRTLVSVYAEFKRLTEEKGKKALTIQDSQHAKQEDVPNESNKNDQDYCDWSSKNIADCVTSIQESKDPSISYVFDYLSMIDDKLDKIIRMMDENTNDSRESIHETIDISASGMRVILEKPIKSGQILEIMMKIPGFPLGRLNTYGKVVRVIKKSESDKEIFDVGVEFLGMSREEQEGLIAFIFCEQRKMIRQSN